MESLSKYFDLGVHDGRIKPTAEFNFQLVKPHFYGLLRLFKPV